MRFNNKSQKEHPGPDYVCRRLQWQQRSHHLQTNQRNITWEAAGEAVEKGCVANPQSYSHGTSYNWWFQWDYTFYKLWWYFSTYNCCIANPQRQHGKRQNLAVAQGRYGDQTRGVPIGFALPGHSLRNIWGKLWKWFHKHLGRLSMTQETSWAEVHFPGPVFSSVWMTCERAANCPCPWVDAETWLQIPHGSLKTSERSLSVSNCLATKSILWAEHHMHMRFSSENTLLNSWREWAKFPTGPWNGSPIGRYPRRTPFSPVSREACELATKLLPRHPSPVKDFTISSHNTACVLLCKWRTSQKDEEVSWTPNLNEREIMK